MHVGIMGGTLDPVHNGHLQIASSVLKEQALDGILLLPAGDPPHKPRHSDKLDRLEMARRAAAGYPGMTVSGIEVLRSGTTYTVDTLRQLNRKHPKVEWIYIIGSDTVHTLHLWRDFEEVSRRCTFVAVGRPGFDDAEMRRSADKLFRRYGTRIAISVVSGPEISSTEIRRRVAAREDISGLVPEGVEALIREKGLYLCQYPWNELERMLADRMKPGRFQHTLGVAETARKLAERFGIDPQRARLAGLLHDCAKPLDPGKIAELAMREGTDVDELELSMTPVLHAPAGMVLAQDEFGVRDPEILSAIRKHTLGDGNLSPLEALIFLADFIEPTRRPFPGLREVRELAETDLYGAAKLSARMSREFVVSRGGRGHPRTDRMLESV